MEKNLLNKIEKLDRNGLKAMCDENNIAYRTKDGTEDIRKKLIKGLDNPSAATGVPVTKTPSKPVVKAPVKAITKTPTKPVKEAIAKVVKSVKDTVEKKAEKKIEVKQIVFRQIGQNIILVIEGKQYTKKIDFAGKRAEIKEQVLKYNEKNDEKIVQGLIKDFTEDNSTVENAVNKYNNKSTEDLINAVQDPELKEALRKSLAEKIEGNPLPPPVAKTTSSKTGEY